MFTDWSLICATRYQTNQRWVRHLSDVYCQYVKNVVKRITPKKLPGMSDDFWKLMGKIAADGKSVDVNYPGRIEGGIPSLHILGHVWICQAV